MAAARPRRDPNAPLHELQGILVFHATLDASRVRLQTSTPLYNLDLAAPVHALYTTHVMAIPNMNIGQQSGPNNIQVCEKRVTTIVMSGSAPVPTPTDTAAMTRRDSSISNNLALCLATCLHLARSFAYRRIERFFQSRIHGRVGPVLDNYRRVVFDPRMLANLVQLCGRLTAAQVITHFRDRDYDGCAAEVWDRVGRVLNITGMPPLPPGVVHNARVLVGQWGGRVKDCYMHTRAGLAAGATPMAVLKNIGDENELELCAQFSAAVMQLSVVAMVYRSLRANTARQMHDAERKSMLSMRVDLSKLILPFINVQPVRKVPKLLVHPTRPGELSVATININSLLNKGDDLSTVIARQGIDVCCVQEVRMWQNEIITVPQGYNVMHMQRRNAHGGLDFRMPRVGGGVAIIYRSSLRITQCEWGYSRDHAEVVVADIKCAGNARVFVASMYLVPRDSAAQRRAVRNHIIPHLQNLALQGDVFVCGDLNCGVPDVNAQRQTARQVMTAELCAALDVAPVSTFGGAAVEATYFKKNKDPRKLDFVLAPLAALRAGEISDFQVQRDPDTVSSDHAMLSFKIDMRAREPVVDERPETIRWDRLHSEPATCNTLRMEMEGMLGALRAQWERAPVQPTPTERMSRVQTDFTRVCRATLGVVTVPVRVQALKRWTRRLDQHSRRTKKALRQRNDAARALELARANGRRFARGLVNNARRTDEHYRSVRRQFNRALKEARLCFDGVMSDQMSWMSVSNKDFWRRLHKYEADATTTQGAAIDVDAAARNLGQRYQHTPFPDEAETNRLVDEWLDGDAQWVPVNDPIHAQRPAVERLSSQEFTTDDFRTAVRRLVPGKASGPDNIPNEMLKLMEKMSDDTLSIFVGILNGLVRQRELPPEWLIDEVVPVYKGKGSRADTTFSSYRPITLESCVRKVFADMARVRMEELCEHNQNLHAYQGAFRKHRGVHTQVLAMLARQHEAVTEGKYMVVVSLDLVKAFDSVRHVLVLDAMRRKGFPPQFGRIALLLLSGTFTRVRAGGARSVVFPVLSGMKQGSPPIPLWFSLFIDSLLDPADRAIIGPNAIAMHELIPGLEGLGLAFADDVLVFAVHEDRNEVMRIAQAKVDEAHAWAVRVGMVWGLVKTWSMNCGAQPSPDSLPNGAVLTLGGQPIVVVASARYLGAMLSHVMQPILPHNEGRIAAIRKELSTHNKSKARMTGWQVTAVYKTSSHQKMLFGTEIFYLNPATAAKQPEFVRRFLRVPRRTHTALTHYFASVWRMKSMGDRRCLNFFFLALRRGPPEYCAYFRSLFVNLDCTFFWVERVRALVRALPGDDCAVVLGTLVLEQDQVALGVNVVRAAARVYRIERLHWNDEVVGEQESEVKAMERLGQMAAAGLTLMDQCQKVWEDLTYVLFDKAEWDWFWGEIRDKVGPEEGEVELYNKKKFRASNQVMKHAGKRDRVAFYMFQDSLRTPDYIERHQHIVQARGFIPCPVCDVGMDGTHHLFGQCDGGVRNIQAGQELMQRRDDIKAFVMANLLSGAVGEQHEDAVEELLADVLGHGALHRMLSCKWRQEGGSIYGAFQYVLKKCEEMMRIRKTAM